VTDPCLTPPTAPDPALAALRRCDVGPHASGALYLAAMPGRHADLESFRQDIARCGISHLLCLAEEHELQRLSPSYLEMIRTGALGAIHDWYPIPDRSVPSDGRSFAALIEAYSGHLASGRNVVIHCAAGIGRSGLFATALLGALGCSDREATQRVSAAGAGPESAMQVEFLKGG
jgi:predicted protein tyrosine phosphatase